VTTVRFQTDCDGARKTYGACVAGFGIGTLAASAGLTMKPLERFLISLDTWPWSALVRVGIGLCSPPVSRALFGSRDSVWIFPAFVIGLLIALRVVPALIRLALPFSVEVKEIWARRRALAKRYDSYQWQKLFWIGIGLVLHFIIAGETVPAEIAVAAVCLIGGSMGLLVWSKVNDARSPLHT
jgi:hypothetical protein